MTGLPWRTLPDVLYHYTTRAWAQEISMAGQISPGSSGKIYLTDVLFKLGWQATDYLSLPDKNAEVVIPILTNVLEALNLNMKYLGLVPEIPARTGRSLRRGGGHQWVYPYPIPVSVLPWSWTELEAP